MLYFDTETTGFCGPVVLIQYAFNDGPIVLHDVWKSPVNETLSLIDSFMQDDVVGFNMTFDSFQLVKIYTMFMRFLDRGGSEYALPEDHIEEMAICELEARDSEYTIKPKSVCDLMLIARKGKYQTLMGRSDIKIRRIPSILAQHLADELEQRLDIDPIYFANKKSKRRWEVVPGKEDPTFSDVVMRFKASGGLKSLAEHAMKYRSKRILKMADVEIDKRAMPIELGYAPFAYAVSKPEDGWQARLKIKGQWKSGFAWPRVIKEHIGHWAYYGPAREYAEDDVTYTRGLWHYFNCPTPGDDDSELSWCVGACRWRGYSVDIEAMKKLREKAIVTMRSTPIDPKKVMWYIKQKMDPVEQAGFTSTKKVVLEKMTKEMGCDCTYTEEGNRKAPDETCEKCKGKGTHPAAERAQEVLDARFAKKEIELYDKLIRAGRLHASFHVIGALSGRMSGADGLNPQGIKRTGEVRRTFTIAWPGQELLGGDFDSFELCITDAVSDGALTHDLTAKYDCYCRYDKALKTYSKEPNPKCEDCLGSGQAPRKLHGLFAMEMYNMTYEEVMATKKKTPDLYTLGKNGVYSMVYFGDWTTLVRKYGVPEDAAKRAFNGFLAKRPGLKKAQQWVIDRHTCITQAGGIGTRVSWQEPAETIESLYGFPRYFTLENSICKALFELAGSIPQSWRDLKIRVTRRVDRGQQFVGGAVSSALYGAAFGLQGCSIRAAGNHRIQSTGSTATKKVQRKIWDLQPAGYHKMLVQPCNIHDEVLCPAVPEIKDRVMEVVNAEIEEIRKVIPLVSMEFKPMKNWSEK